MTAASEIVEEAIANNKVILFTKSYCPYCKRAKALLDLLNIKYAHIDMDLHPDGEEMQNYLHDKTGQRTVPNIFINQKHIGGSDDLAKLEADGGIKALVT